jgi:hypothetical protein
MNALPPEPRAYALLHDDMTAAGAAARRGRRREA